VIQLSVACELPARRMLSAGVNTGAALNVSLNVKTIIKIRNNFNNIYLAVFARSVSLALVRYPIDYNT
jgi:hypothetical protein